MSVAPKPSFSPITSFLTLTALLLVCLVPFLNKPVHIDDTLFLRAARQIEKHPANFYGFNMNWYGTEKPMPENFNNPPLAAYYLALVGSVGGWSEPVLHFAFLLPAIAAASGLYSLARRFQASPLFAAAAGIVMPVFVVSATTLMCDIMLLAFWVWALVFFEQSLQSNSRAGFLFSGLLASLACLTKFTGLALIPLIAVYGACKKRRPGFWTVVPAVALAFVAGFEWLSFLLYGKGLLLAAAGVSAQTTAGVPGSFCARQLIGLLYLGGCFLPALFLAPWLWSARQLIIGLCLLAPFLLVFPYLGQFALLWRENGDPNWVLCMQGAIFLANGINILALAIHDLQVCKDAASLLLVLWVFGVLFFASAVNWTLNGRSLLPMLPAVGLLLARQFERRAEAADSQKQMVPLSIRWAPTTALLLGLAISLLVTKADYALAAAGRSAARELCSKYHFPGKTLWFEGHWGFQYYMEEQGARALDHEKSCLAAGDIIIIPSEAVNVFDLSTNYARFIDRLDYIPNHGLSTMSRSAGAGFYAATAGPFPFSAGPIASEHYYAFVVTQPVTSSRMLPEGIFGPGVLACQLAIERQKPRAVARE